MYNNMLEVRCRLADTQDSKMASSIPAKGKKLVDVKLGELPRWIPMQDFTPEGVAGVFQRGYCGSYKQSV